MHESWERTTAPTTRASSVAPRAPQMGLLPMKGPSGLRFLRLSKRRQAQKVMATPRGTVGSVDTDIHADLPHSSATLHRGKV